MIVFAYLTKFQPIKIPILSVGQAHQSRDPNRLRRDGRLTCNGHHPIHQVLHRRILQQGAYFLDFIALK